MSSVVTYTTDASGAQDGSYVGGWDDALDGLTLSTGFPPSTVGIVFTYGLSFDAEGRPIDPPIVSGLQLRLTTHPTVVADPGTDTLELWMVPETAPANYAGISLFPFNRSEVLVAAATYTWAGVGTTVTWTLGTYLTADNANTATCTSNWHEVRMTYMASSRWSGRVAFSLRNLSGAALSFAFNSSETAGQAPELLSTQDPWFGAVENWPLDKGRVRRCPRTGLPFMAYDAVQDGYRQGLWLSPKGYDPEDRTGKDFFPPPEEGVIDDEVS